MPSVDNRVVSMIFDNKRFEENASNTMKTLSGLRDKLSAFSGSANAFAGVNEAAKGVDLKPITTALEDITNKFTAMGAIAFSVISNITNRAVDAGISLAKALSLDQVVAGFREYELNMGAIQTILSNTMADNTTLEDVNKALDVLNEYSDQTIYNFGEMTRNIGTFTAAGIDLDTSTSAIKGIANLAAISGSNSQQASTAMYQLSQALAAGQVKLMDWNSVVNAGMGGQVFQEALFETGKALGTIKDVPIDQSFEQWKDAGNSFRNSLQDGWITADVLTNTLQGFTGDLTDAQLLSMGYTEDQVKQIQKLGKTGKDAATKVKTFTQLVSTVKESIGSGWSQSFRIVIGDFEEARSLFTKVNAAIGKVFGENADARNKFLQSWKDLGGRTKLIGAFRAAIINLAKVLNAVKDAFNKIFPAMTAKQFYDLTLRFNEFIKSLKPSKSVLKAIRQIFLGVFSVVRIGIEIFKGLSGVVIDLVKRFVNVGDAKGGILGFLAKIGSSLFDLKKLLVDGRLILNFFDSFSETLDNFITGLSFNNVIKKVIGLFVDLKNALSDSVTGLDSAVLNDAIENIQSRFRPVVNAIEKVADAIMWVAGKAKQAFEFVKKFSGNFLDYIIETFGDIPMAIANLFAKADYNQALDTVNTGLFGGLVLLVKKFMDSGGLDLTGGFLDNVNKVLGSLSSTLKAMETKVKADAILKIAIAVGVLAVALLILASIDSVALTKGLIAAAGGFAVLIAALTALNTFVKSVGGASKLAVLALALIGVAAALVVMSIALKILSTMSWDELLRGTAAIGALLIELSVAVRIMSGNTRGMIKAGVGIFAIALALIVLAVAVKLFSMMSWQEIGKGLAAVAAGLIAITLAIKKMPMFGTKQKGLGLLALAAGLLILAVAFKIFATMSWEELGKGIASVSALLLVMTLALRKMPKGSSLAKQGTGLLAMSAGLLLIAVAMKLISTLSWEEIGKGLTGIAGALLLLVIASKLMSGTALGALSILLMSAALLVLQGVLASYASMKWETLLKGLSMLGLTILALAFTATAISAILPAMFALAAVLALVGIGFLLFGAGLSLVAGAWAVFLTATMQGLDTLAGALVLIIKLIPEFLLAIGKGIVVLVTEIAKGLPGVIVELGKAIGALIQLLIDNIPLLAEAVLVLIKELLRIVIEAAPDIVTAGFTLLMTLLRGISENIYEITNTVVTIITQFMTAMTERMPEIVAKGVELLVSFLNGIAQNLSTIATAVGNIVTAFITELGNLSHRIVTAGADALIDFLDGVVESIPKIAAKVTEIIDAFLTAFATETPKIVDAGFQMFIDLFNGLADTLRNRSGELGKAMGNLVSALVTGIGNALKEGIKQIANDLFPGLGTVVDGVLDFFGIASPSKKFYWIGEQLMLGFQIGIDKNFAKPTDSLTEGSNGMLDTMSTTMGKISDVLKSDMDASPKIRPVVDLSGVTKGANEINGMLNNDVALSTSVALSQASVISTATNAAAAETTTTQPTATQITFEQNNYSPESLSAADIYRQTRNQIVMAKEALAGV